MLQLFRTTLSRLAQLLQCSGIWRLLHARVHMNETPEEDMCSCTSRHGRTSIENKTIKLFNSDVSRQVWLTSSRSIKSRLQKSGDSRPCPTPAEKFLD
uniref:Putative secreted protein n=1 Tax=Ixodes ricinus TaxID=34613 RepID=A0A6B0UFB9_IXORI